MFVKRGTSDLINAWEQSKEGKQSKREVGKEGERENKRKEERMRETGQELTVFEGKCSENRECGMFLIADNDKPMENKEEE